MRLSLLHNPTAGDEQPPADELRRALARAGFEVAYQSTDDADGLARALERPADLLVVAGGDGTVGKVALALRERGVPLVILPLGTANNVARSLGADAPVADLLAALRPERVARFTRTALALASARGPWGEARFLESAGVGALATLLREAETAKRDGGSDGAGDGGAHGRDRSQEKIAEGRSRLARVIARAPLRTWQVEADGRDLSGRYAMVEVVCIRTVGPRVALGPSRRRPGDGPELRLVLVDETERTGLARQLADPAAAADESRVTVHAVRRVRLGWDPDVGHLDDTLWPTASAGGREGVTGDRPVVDLARTDPPLQLQLLLPLASHDSADTR